jgi:hypothetical protein
MNHLDTFADSGFGWRGEGECWRVEGGTLNHVT